MEAQEHIEFLKQMYPVGEERWLKVKYLDFNKCLKSIRFENGMKEELGFEFTAIGTVQNYIPQVEAIVDLKDEMKEAVYLQQNIRPEAAEVVSSIIDKLFDNKIRETINKMIIERK